MNSFIKRILLLFVLLLIFSIGSFAQIRFIDNMGTINTVNGTASSPNNTITFTGTPTNSLFNNIGFDITPSTSNNQVLITNGLGIVNWVNFSSLNHTGTTGSVFFANSTTGAPTENNNQFFWDNINYRLGIGTTTPNNKLEVNGHIRMTDGNQAANTIMVGDANGTASWSTISSAIGSIDNHTDVDVSTTTPTNNQILSWDGTNWVPTNETLTTIVDNNNGTFSYTDENGSITTLDVSNLETLTYIALNIDDTNIDYTDEDGVVTKLDLTNLVHNLETLTSIVDNHNGTFSYTDEDGGITTLDVKNLETLTYIALNADDTNIDYTDEDGNVTQLNLTNIVHNLETLTTIVDNNNGTFSYTDEDGGVTSLDVKNLETLTYIALNADNTNIDYTDEDGAVTQLNLTNIVHNLETLTIIVDNNDGTFSYTDEDGGITTLDVKNLETLTYIALNADDTNIDYTDEDGVITQINLTNLVHNLETLTTIVDNGNGTFSYTDEDGGVTSLDVANLETLTYISLNADNTNIDYTDEDGVVTQLNLTNIVHNLETLTIFVDNNDGTFSYTDEDGGVTTLDISNLETLTYIALNSDDTNIDYTDEEGVVTQLNLTALVHNLETLTTIVDNHNGTFSYTDEDGGVTTLNVKNLETLTYIALNTDNTNIDYTDEEGVVTQLDLTNLVNNLETLTTINNTVIGNKIAGYTNEDGIVTDIFETTTTLTQDATDNLKYTYENETGTNVIFTASPVIAFGKVNSNGSAARIYGATVIRNSTGSYTVTLPVARSTSNYIIQLSILDSNGTGNDNYTISYSNQTISSFDVQIGDNDNGKKKRANRDYEFMFTVIDY